MTNLSTNGQKAYESALRMHGHATGDYAAPGRRPAPEDFAHITDAETELHDLQGAGLGSEVAPEPLDGAAKQVLGRMQESARVESRARFAGGGPDA